MTDPSQPLVAVVRRCGHQGIAEDASERQEGRHHWADEDADTKLGDADPASCATVVSPADTSLESPTDRNFLSFDSANVLVDDKLQPTTTHETTDDRPACFTELVKLFSESKHLTSAQNTDIQDPDEALRALDFEEQGTGYQASYSKLAASETVEEDPVAYIQNPREFVGQELARVAKTDAQLRNRIQAADSAVVVPFMQALAGSGFVL